MATPAIVLFTQGLRVHDHPAPSAATERSGPVLPVLVLDPAVAGRSSRNRLVLLTGALADLRSALRDRGGDLLLLRGGTVERVTALAEETGADTVHLTGGVSSLAARRARRLRDTGLGVRSFPGLTVIPPGEITPAKGDHDKVFTPCWRAWEAHTWRDPAPAPGPGVPVRRPAPGLPVTAGGRAGRAGPTTSTPSSWTGTSPTTPATGSGWRAPATTPGPTGRSTRCARPAGSTPTAPTSAATCRSWPAWRGARAHTPWHEEHPPNYPPPIADPGR